jgi:hypothetical protein
MPYQIKLTDNVLRSRFYGKVTPEDLWEQGLALREFESAASVTPHRITDVTEAVGADINFMVMNAYAAQRKFAPLRNRVRAAIVARTTLQYGLARMYQNLSDNPLLEIKIFEDTASALAWVSGPEQNSLPTVARVGGVKS